MKIFKKLHPDDHNFSNNFALSHCVKSSPFSWVVLLALGIALSLASADLSFAQGTRGVTAGSTTRGFLVYGDVKVDESRVAAGKPVMLEVILYTKGMQVVARQRINPNGRYRFMDIFDGDYWLVLELEGAEVARDSLFIAKSMTMDIKHDLELEWRSPGTSKSNSSVVSAADLYDRSAPNNLLYHRSVKEIEGKRYPDAIATLRGLVAADPKDFQAWGDLGMLYFIQKDFENAEKSYLGSLTAKPTYFSGAFNLGKVQLAAKKYEPAIASFEAALKIDPKSAAANYFLGEAYLQIKKGSKAVGYLNEALALDPAGMAEAHLRLAALYNGAGMKDKAVAEYEQFLKKKPDYADRQKLEKYIADNKQP